MQTHCKFVWSTWEFKPIKKFTWESKSDNLL